ncbi:MAG: hypothetical protein ACI9F9_002749, partial [Candidatus Paceibacteria bacterium]
MNRLILPTVLTFVLAQGQELSTQYTTDRGLRTEVTSQFHVETVDFSMERDGEPVESGRGGGGSSSEERTITMIDTVLAEEDGKPTHVRREFESITSKATRSRGEDETESEAECPLSGVAIEITDDGGDVTVEVVEGSEPDNEKILEGHGAAVALDSLLPEDEMAPGDSWSISGEGLAMALGFNLEHALFPRPEPEAREGGDGERGGRGRGRGGRGGNSSANRYFAAGDWEVEATLGSETEEYDGQDCYVITIEGDASGEVPEPERGGGRGNDRAVGMTSAPAVLETNFDADVEGTLYISVDGHH